MTEAPPPPDMRGRPPHVTESARLHGEATLGEIERLLASRSGRTWNDAEADPGSVRWADGSWPTGTTVSIRLDPPKLRASPPIVRVCFGPCEAIVMECKQRDADALAVAGPAATVTWCLAACRAALEHGTSPAQSRWDPRPSDILLMHERHPETFRHLPSHLHAVHPSPISDAAIRHRVDRPGSPPSRIYMEGDDASFVPERVCRIVAGSSPDAATSAILPHRISMYAPHSSLELPGVDPMDVLRTMRSETLRPAPSEQEASR